MSDLIKTNNPLPLKSELVTKIWDDLSTQIKKKLSLEEIRDIISDLPFETLIVKKQPVTLKINRLIFSGTKRLSGRPEKQFKYDQEFKPGVNIICVEKNEGGKSSIIKSIKFALTGDGGDYDIDVKSWIENLWLSFSINNREYTVLHSIQEERAVLVLGKDFRNIVEAENGSNIIFNQTGSEKVKESLQHFFFEHLKLDALSWTQQDKSSLTGVSERKTSWLTYFQAMYMPGGSDEYLICDSKHAMGNQDGLIISSFLGLNHIEALNKLSVDISKNRKSAEIEEKQIEDKANSAKTQLVQLHKELQEKKLSLTRLKKSIQDRRAAVIEQRPIQRIDEANSELLSLRSEKYALEENRDEINRSLKTMRRLARNTKEAIDFQLHFTGIDVSLCPCCDNAVDEESIIEESQKHICRLCGKQAFATDVNEIETLKQKLNEVDSNITELEHIRTGVTNRLTTIADKVSSLTTELHKLESVLKEGVSYANISPEEEQEQEKINREIGKLEAEIVRLESQASAPSGKIESLKSKVYATEKVRDYIKKIANESNQQVLNELSRLTQESARKIGAESISDVSCSALGKLKLSKHGNAIAFGGIQNDGERLRIKLAFFLAMMQLGQSSGLGRHPAFLMIDQPGSAEMVEADVIALTDILKQVDTDLSSRIQIICCTARPEFKNASEKDKIYGPQDPPDAF